jgi:hypothetical protein
MIYWLHDLVLCRRPSVVGGTDNVPWCVADWFERRFLDTCPLESSEVGCH